MPQEVAKENQQYRLCLQYEYIGSSEQEHKLLKKDLEKFNEVLPMGYTAKSEDNNWSWGGKDNKQYLLLLRHYKINCVTHYFFSKNSSVGERPAPRGGTTCPDERKITII